MAFTENLAAYFQTTDFAVQARWSYDNSLVPGIFDAAYTDPLGSFEGSVPMFVCEAALMQGAAQGQTLIIGTSVYTIAEVMPDGTGVLQLRLRG